MDYEPIDISAWCNTGAEYYGYTHYDVCRRSIFAHTSPIYISVGGTWRMFDKETAQYMLTLIDGAMTDVENRSRQHAHGYVAHHHGEDDHLGFLNRPLLEARQSVQQRIREHRVAWLTPATAGSSIGIRAKPL